MNPRPLTDLDNRNRAIRYWRSFGLSSRAAMAIFLLGVADRDSLRRYSPRQLLDIVNCGTTTVKEICAFAGIEYDRKTQQVRTEAKHTRMAEYLRSHGWTVTPPE